MSASIRLYQRDAGACQMKPECMKSIMRYFDEHPAFIKDDTVVYRGQTVEGQIDPTRRGFFSASVDEDIAADFAGRDGFLFKIHLKPGVQYIEIEEEKNESGYSYEKEYLIKSGGIFKERPGSVSKYELDYWPSIAAAAAAAAGAGASEKKNNITAKNNGKKPIGRAEVVKRIKEAYDELGIEMDEEPTNAEIYAHLGAHEKLVGGARRSGAKRSGTKRGSSRSQRRKQHTIRKKRRS